jgi:hypothetical protein
MESQTDRVLTEFSSFHREVATSVCAEGCFFANCDLHPRWQSLSSCVGLSCLQQQLFSRRACTPRSHSSASRASVVLLLLLCLLEFVGGRVACRDRKESLRICMVSHAAAVSEKHTRACSIRATCLVFTDQSNARACGHVDSVLPSTQKSDCCEHRIGHGHVHDTICSLALAPGLDLLACLGTRTRSARLPWLAQPLRTHTLASSFTDTAGPHQTKSHMLTRLLTRSLVRTRVLQGTFVTGSCQT